MGPESEGVSTRPDPRSGPVATRRIAPVQSPPTVPVMNRYTRLQQARGSPKTILPVIPDSSGSHAARSSGRAAQLFAGFQNCTGATGARARRRLSKSPGLVEAAAGSCCYCPILTSWGRELHRCNRAAGGGASASSTLPRALPRSREMAGWDPWRPLGYRLHPTSSPRRVIRGQGPPPVWSTKHPRGR